MADASVPDPLQSLAERDLLRALLQQLSSRVRREQLETWFRSLDVRRADDREIELSVTSQFVRDWLQKNYLGVLTEAVSALGQTKRRVLLTHRDEDGWDSLRFAQPQAISDEIDRLVRLRDDRTPPSPAAETSAQPGAGARTPTYPAATGLGAGGAGAVGHGPVTSRRLGNALNPNYTFDKFVVGPCNRLAHASALAIGENPGCAYNPLFVHGNVGLGKSHLLQAICHTVQRRDPNARVLYLSCEDFTNAFIQAIQSHQLDAFRQLYRSADVLVIDDVQFLANKEKTQDEFFHTFNTLYDAQKQIVLSSDRPPIEIPTIEERLVSRFKWGLVAEVEAPCLDTRVAIVRRKAAGRGVDLPEDVARFLAERVTTNIRELEGAVIKVVGIAAITDQPITLALAESCVRGMPLRHSQVSADDVMTLITTEFAISARELTGKGRTQTVSLPRQVAMFLLREHTENSLEDVGRIFGNRDHTTVLYAVNKIRERAQKDRMFKELLDGLSNRLLTRSFRS
ncbi:MAG: chromosomal replication initiator protein DnaA [Planctomycetes bacterium]|nr:chromosomal replication initiator protein DnaA [Planctomycetota bacterium]